MKTNIKDLRQRLSDLKAEGRKALDDVKTLRGQDTVSAEDETKITALEARMDALDPEIEVLEADIVAEETRLNREYRFAEPAAPVQALLEVTSNEPDPAGMCGFANLADFALAVRGAHPQSPGSMDPRLTAMVAQPTNFMQESGTEEGYMVPPTMREQIWEMIFSGIDVLTKIDMEPTSSNAVTFIRDETTPWGTTGVVAKWAGEGTQLVATKVVTKAEMQMLHKLYAFVLATDELLEDAPRLNARLTRRAAEAILWKASDAIIYGTGVGQPLGWFTSAALVSVAKEGGQAADTILVANILKMFSRLLVLGNAMNIFWLANRDIVPQLAALTIGNIPVWTPPVAGLTVAPGGFLLGSPIDWSEHARTLGDKGDLTLVNPNGYYGIEKRGGVQFAQSMHLFFDYGVGAFRWTFRMGGQPFLSAPVTPANGTNTKSHFVTLDERA